MDFTGKVVILTGASSGIGSALALKLTKNGADVVLVARNRIKLEKVAHQCALVGKLPLIVAANLVNHNDVIRIIEETTNEYGRINVLINNAGFGSLVSFDSPECMKEFDKVISLNLRAVVQLTSLAMPHLAETKGVVVNVSSMVSVIPLIGSWSYCVAKAGVDHFTRCIAAEIAPKGIRVTAVNPGPVKGTNFFANLGLADKEESFLEYCRTKSILKRLSEPEELAEIIMFVASENGRSVTGTTWLVDNGYVLG